MFRKVTKREESQFMGYLKQEKRGLDMSQTPHASSPRTPSFFGGNKSTKDHLTKLRNAYNRQAQGTPPLNLNKALEDLIAHKVRHSSTKNNISARAKIIAELREMPDSGFKTAALASLVPSNPTQTSAPAIASTRPQPAVPRPPIRAIPQKAGPLLNEAEMAKAQSDIISVMARYKEANPTIPDIETQTLELKLQTIVNLMKNPNAPTPNLSPENIKICKAMAMVAAVVKASKGHTPRINQFLSTLLFVEGKDKNALGQIRTGQGKTLIAAMTAITRAYVYGQTVCLSTTTDALAESGLKEMADLYGKCGIEASYFDARTNSVARETQGKTGGKVIYTTAFNLSADKVSHNNGHPTVLPIWQDMGNTCIIADECDSVLYDNAASRIRSSHPLPQHERIMAYGQQIADTIKDYYSDEANGTNLEYVGNPLGFKANLKAEMLGRNETTTPPDLKFFIEKEMPKWIEDGFASMDPKSTQFSDGVQYLKSNSLIQDLTNVLAKVMPHLKTSPPLNAALAPIMGALLTTAETLQNATTPAAQSTPLLTTLKKQTREVLAVLTKPEFSPLIADDTAFIDRTLTLLQRLDKLDHLQRSDLIDAATLQKELRENQILYIDDKTGQIIPNMKFAGLTHLFLEYREFGHFIGTPTTSLDYQSQIGILKDAGCIVGFTGTLPDVADDERQYAEFTDLMHTLYGGDTKMSAVPDFTPSRRIDHPEQIRTEQDWKHAILGNIASKKQTQPILLVCETYGEAQQFRDYLTQKGHPVKGLYRDKTDAPIIQYTYRPGDIIITTRLGSRGTDWHVDKSCAGLHVICGFKPDDIRQLGQIKGRAARSGDPGSFQLIAKEKPETARTNLRAHVKSACYDDLFSGVYRSLLQGIQKLPLSPEDKKTHKQNLILFFSMDDVKKAIIAGAEESLENNSIRPLQAKITTLAEGYPFTAAEKDALALSVCSDFVSWAEKFKTIVLA